MRLLDLYCSAGGAGMGYSEAGFEVVGVDIAPQPHYPFEFHQSDAIEFLTLHGSEFDAIHASPPCQKHSSMTKGLWKDRVLVHPELISPTRKLLILLGKPFIIENVMGSPLIMPVMLCGTMFGLGTKSGAQLRWHRLFETNWQVGLTPPCQHKKATTIGVYGGAQHPQKRIPATIPVYGHSGGSSKRDFLDFSYFKTQDRMDAMGIDWMNNSELTEAIPPAYTKFLGERLMEYINAQKI